MSSINALSIYRSKRDFSMPSSFTRAHVTIGRICLWSPKSTIYERNMLYILKLQFLAFQMQTLLSISVWFIILTSKKYPWGHLQWIQLYSNMKHYSKRNKQKRCSDIYEKYTSLSQTSCVLTCSGLCETKGMKASGSVAMAHSSIRICRKSIVSIRIGFRAVEQVHKITSCFMSSCFWASFKTFL